MSELNKSIGLWQGTGMMLSIVLGAGLLALPGLAAETAGSGALYVWLACAAVSVPLLAVFAIVGRLHPDAGGIAAIMKKAFGNQGYAPATFLFLGAVSVGLPSIALVGGEYAAAAIGASQHVVAIVLIVAATAVNLLSSRLANRISAALASAVILVLVLLAIFGWQATSPSFDQIVNADVPKIAVFGLTFMMVFFAFTGWEVAANLAGEFRNPKRDLPLAMAMSFVVALILYLVLAWIVAAAGPLAATGAPFTAILTHAYGQLAGWAVSVVAIVLIFANLSAAIWAVSRMFYSAAKEGVISNRIAQTSSGIPVLAILLTAAILISVSLLAYSDILNLEDLLAAAGMNFLLLYAGAAAALATLSSRGTHLLLSAGSLLVVLALVLGRGVEHVVYPTALVVLGLVMSARRSRPKFAPVVRRNVVSGDL
ncbi:MAG: amino acid permease [Paracoccaceae bacterium]|nr:amino acid permease [Paracoccaceae bacterium]